MLRGAIAATRARDHLRGCPTHNVRCLDYTSAIIEAQGLTHPSLMRGTAGVHSANHGAKLTDFPRRMGCLGGGVIRRAPEPMFEKTVA